MALPPAVTGRVGRVMPTSTNIDKTTGKYAHRNYK